MTIALSLAIIVGILKGFETIEKTRNGSLQGVKPSSNLLDYLLNNE